MTWAWLLACSCCLLLGFVLGWIGGSARCARLVEGMSEALGAVRRELYARTGKPVSTGPRDRQPRLDPALVALAEQARSREHRRLEDGTNAPPTPPVRGGRRRSDAPDLALPALPAPPAPPAAPGQHEGPPPSS